jgi:hypothetical protein
VGEIVMPRNVPCDPDIHKAACKIAVQCRRIIQGLLRDEEIVDCDREFYRVARQIIEQLAAHKQNDT